jgi:hypothetical protein
MLPKGIERVNTVVTSVSMRHGSMYAYLPLSDCKDLAGKILLLEEHMHILFPSFSVISCIQGDHLLVNMDGEVTRRR